MPFTESEKLKVLSIVSVFETSKPLGAYAACAVLNDGAGVSYGICQFTHRSGSLGDVVERYLAAGGRIGTATLELSLPWLKKRTPYAIKRLAASNEFKKALIGAAVTREMKDAQHVVAFQRYLRPAIDFCDARGYEQPLSLAVVYDSIVHGSFDRIARKVRVTPLGVRAASTEQAWITDYVRKRHFWLSNIRRLKSTTYRTKFFLDQIAIGNWDLKLPLNVHGVVMSEPPAPTGGTTTSVNAPVVPDHNADLAAASVPPAHAGDSDKAASIDSTQPTAERSPTSPQPEAGLDTASVIATATETFDRVDNTITGVATRTDRAKSLWTTVAGATWQTAWAVLGWIAGIPREVWIVVALIVAMLVFVYLYRQITLGKLREARGSTG